MRSKTLANRTGAAATLSGPSLQDGQSSCPLVFRKMTMRAKRSLERRSANDSGQCSRLGRAAAKTLVGSIKIDGAFVREDDMDFALGGKSHLSPGPRQLRR